MIQQASQLDFEKLWQKHQQLQAKCERLQKDYNDLVTVLGGPNVICENLRKTSEAISTADATPTRNEDE